MLQLAEDGGDRAASEGTAALGAVSRRCCGSFASSASLVQVACPAVSRSSPGRRHALDAVPRLLRAARHDRGPDGKPVNALLGTANLILREVEEHEPRAVVLCFGPDAAAYRIELYPAYHAERPEDAGRARAPVRRRARLLRGVRLDGGGQRRPRGRRPARHLRPAARRRPAAAALLHDRRPRHVPVRERAGDGALRAHRRQGRRRGRARRRCASATGSTPSWCPTSSPCAATPPTGCPGAKGVGQKTAAELLRRHGSLEAVLDGAIREHAPDAARAPCSSQREELLAFKDIATLRDAGVKPPPDAPTDWAGAAAAARERGMKRLAERLDGAGRRAGWPAGLRLDR